MAVKTGKAMRSKELLKRRFKLDLKMIKKVCEKLDITLLSNKDDYVHCDAICIISRNEYNVGCFFDECDDTESYFLTRNDYEIYSEYMNGGL